MSFDTTVQLRDLDRALEFDKNFANLYALKAVVYAFSIVDRSGGRALGTESAAVESLALANADIALDLDPSSTAAYIARGDIHRFFWRWKDAISAYERAYELSPNNTDVVSRLADLLSWSGQHERAISRLERAVELDPHWATTRWNLGVTLAQAGRPADARDVLRKAAAMDPTAGYIRHWLGQMEAASGNACPGVLSVAKSDCCITRLPATTASMPASKCR